jgi:uncharacterized protein involved in type VI secretion and phage assembly
MRREDQRGRWVREMVGEIDSYDPKSHTAKVKFDTDLDNQGNPRISGWLPHRVTSAGANGSMVFGPTPGDQVVVHYAEGDQEGGVISHFVHNDVHKPPKVESGEFNLTSHSAVVFIDKNSNVSITTSGNITMQANQISLTASGQFTINGNKVDING